jgi:hypothetical protein
MAKSARWRILHVGGQVEDAHDESDQSTGMSRSGSAPVLPPSSERLVAKNKNGYDLSVPLREGGQDGKSIVLYSPRIARTAHISLYVYEE